MSFLRYRISAILERVEADLIVVKEDPLVAEELQNLIVWSAPCLSPTLALDELDVELACVVGVKVTVETQILLINALELPLVKRDERLSLRMRLEELSSFAVRVLWI